MASNTSLATVARYVDRMIKSAIKTKAELEKHLARGPCSGKRRDGLSCDICRIPSNGIQQLTQAPADFALQNLETQGDTFGLSDENVEILVALMQAAYYFR